MKRLHNGQAKESLCRQRYIIDVERSEQSLPPVWKINFITNQLSNLYHFSPPRLRKSLKLFEYEADYLELDAMQPVANTKSLRAKQSRQLGRVIIVIILKCHGLIQFSWEKLEPDLFDFKHTLQRRACRYRGTPQFFLRNTLGSFIQTCLSWTHLAVKYTYSYMLCM